MPKTFAILLRLVFLYLFFLLLSRLSGKRFIGQGKVSGKDLIVQGAPVDFVVALVVSDLLDDVILAGVPVAQGVVAIGSVMLLHALLAFAAYRNESLARLLGL